MQSDTLLGGAVLLVDDDPPNLDVLKAFLEGDYTVLEAQSGDAALALIDHPDLDVIVTDQRMPGLTGIELLAAARQRRPDVAGIVLTAYTDTPALIAAINQAQAFRFLRKPWRAEDVVEAIAQARLHVQQTRTIAHLIRTLEARNGELQATVSELRHARQELVRAERAAAVGQLAAGLAHDLREAISGLLLVEDEVLASPLGQTLGDTVRVGVAGIRNLADAVDAIARHAGGAESARTHGYCSAARVATQAVAALGLDPALRNRSVSAELPRHSDVTLRADQPQLVHAVANLVRYAAHGAPRGQPIVVQLTRADPAMAAFSVGVADLPADHPAISGQWQVPDPAATRRDEVALYLAHVVAENHGGSLEIERRSGGGTRMVLRIPLAAQSEAA
ncbi:MAG: hybrid sensor histidine kinase/response regulator [Deltaproteobacteria bacterium]|nr:hybrid sensor histidine kinase/response regulator [Deltaproteobacteria bacterium]